MSAIAPSDRLASLQRRFLLSMEGRLFELSALVNSSTDPEPVMRRFHSLAGIAGTYGFDGVTDVSLECEGLCVAVIEQARLLSEIERERLRRGIDRMREEAAAPPRFLTAFRTRS